MSKYVSYRQQINDLCNNSLEPIDTKSKSVLLGENGFFYWNKRINYFKNNLKDKDISKKVLGIINSNKYLNKKYREGTEIRGKINDLNETIDDYVKNYSKEEKVPVKESRNSLLGYLCKSKIGKAAAGILIVAGISWGAAAYMDKPSEARMVVVAEASDAHQRPKIEVNYNKTNNDNNLLSKSQSDVVDLEKKLMSSDYSSKGSLKEYSEELRTAHPDKWYGNLGNAVLDLTTGAHQKIQTEEGYKVKQYGRTGVFEAAIVNEGKSLLKGIKNITSGITLGAYTPKGEEKPKGFFGRLKHSGKKIAGGVFGDIVYKTVNNWFWDTPGALIRTGNDVVQAIVDMPEQAIRIGAKKGSTRYKISEGFAAPFEVIGQLIEENGIGGTGTNRVIRLDLEKIIKGKNIIEKVSGLPIINNLVHGTDGNIKYNPDGLKSPEKVFNGSAAINDNVDGNNIGRRITETIISPFLNWKEYQILKNIFKKRDNGGSDNGSEGTIGESIEKVTGDRNDGPGGRKK